MVRKLFFIFTALGFILAGCGGGPDMSTRDIRWSYVKSPSGKCLEVGTHMTIGTFSYTISTPVEEKYCQPK